LGGDLEGVFRGLTSWGRGWAVVQSEVWRLPAVCGAGLGGLGGLQRRLFWVGGVCGGFGRPESGSGGGRPPLTDPDHPSPPLTCAPRSPRATMTPSAASMIESMFARQSMASSLATSSIGCPGARCWWIGCGARLLRVCFLFREPGRLAAVARAWSRRGSAALPALVACQTCRRAPPGCRMKDYPTDASVHKRPKQEKGQKQACPG
jgi:hypothetical protein